MDGRLVYGLQEGQAALCVQKRNMEQRTGTCAISQEVALGRRAQLVGAVSNLRRQPQQLFKLGGELGGAGGGDRLGHFLRTRQQKGSECLGVAR